MQDKAAGSASPVEWNAAVYHRVSNPHVDWGTRVLARVPLRGNEVVLDAGCGTGRLTGQLLERLPEGRVYAMDRSSNMLEQARAHLEPAYGDRVIFLEQDLRSIDLPEPVDVVFSTATFHWLLDHDALFRDLFAVLKPGGHLIAQCGGGPNLARLAGRLDGLVAVMEGAEALQGWSGPWEFSSDVTAKERMERAGFVDVATSLEEAPTFLDDAETYREFVRTVIMRAHLDRLGDEALGNVLLDELTEMAAADDPAFFLDYWRLNLAGKRPG